MSNLISSLQVATVANALLWPLAAGVVVVVLWKLRAAGEARRIAAAEAELQRLYHAVEADPVPVELDLVIEALEEGDELAGRPAAKTAATPARS
jgi:hypothetical protein